MSSGDVHSVTVYELARAVVAMNNRIDDHETRLRAVERWMAGLPPTLVLGVATIAGTIAGAVIGAT